VAPILRTQVDPRSEGFAANRDALLGALADIAGGYAGLTRAPEGMEVTTVEYKINFLAAFSGGELRARGHVVRAGKRLIITTAEKTRNLQAKDQQEKAEVSGF